LSAKTGSEITIKYISTMEPGGTLEKSY